MTRSRVGLRLALIAVATFPCATAAQESLPEDQIANAIALGRAG
jgi:hypothetical protein